MKNCIVLSGQYRTFDQTWENIKRFIDLNQLDVYCHLWSDSQDEFNNVIERLNPVRIKLENYEVHKEEFEMMERRIRTMNPKNPNQDKIAGNASMNYSRKKAFDLIDDEYDTLVYCRYDIKFGQLFDFKDVDMLITPFEESYNLISDIFAIMPFSYAKHYFLYDVYERLHIDPKPTEEKSTIVVTPQPVEYNDIEAEKQAIQSEIDKINRSGVSGRKAGPVIEQLQMSDGSLFDD